MTVQRALRHSKGTEQTHRKGQETESEGISSCQGFLNKKLEKCPHKITANPTARADHSVQMTSRVAQKIKKATRSGGSSEAHHHTPDVTSPCVMTDGILPSLWAQDPPWATGLTQPHLDVPPAPGPHPLGCRGFSSGTRTSISVLSPR